MERILRIASYYTPEANRIASDDNAPQFYFSGVYLHGEVERLCNYDICYPTNPEDFPEGVVDITTKYSNRPEPVTNPYLFLEGIFPCVVDEKYECTAFLWYDHEMVEQHKADSHTMRGLIVLKNDEEGMEDAREYYPCYRFDPASLNDGVDSLSPNYIESLVLLGRRNPWICAQWVVACYPQLLERL